MTQIFWLAEGVAIGVGDEIANSLAARILALQTGQGVDTAEIAKIDNAAVDGLLGVADSLAYKVHEIEKHFHNRERWFGKLAVQTATDWAENNLSPFRAISGNNDYGTEANDEALIFGTADTPAIVGGVKYDAHRLFIIDASSTTIWKLQLIYGSGTMAAAIAAGQFSTVMVKVDAAAAATPALPVDIITPRLTCGVDKMWMRAWNATDNATIDFFAGIHEYNG
jgi:hypothetical protein